jgi:hypothetical protein
MVGITLIRNSSASGLPAARAISASSSASRNMRCALATIFLPNGVKADDPAGAFYQHQPEQRFQLADTG